MPCLDACFTGYSVKSQTDLSQASFDFESLNHGLGAIALPSTTPSQQGSNQPSRMTMNGISSFGSFSSAAESLVNDKDLSSHTMMQQDFCIVGDPVLLPLENSCDSDFSFCSTPASPQVSPRPTTSIKAESLIDSSFYYESTITSHTESMDQLFTPSTCGDTISQPPSTKPLRRREYKCPYCGRKSNRSNNMKEHILTHDPNRPKNFYCTVCPKRFARKHDLKRHHQSHERSIKKTMSTCGMVFCLD